MIFGSIVGSDYSISPPAYSIFSETDTPSKVTADTHDTHHATALAADNDTATLCETPGCGPEMHAATFQCFELPLWREKETSSGRTHTTARDASFSLFFSHLNK